MLQYLQAVNVCVVIQNTLCFETAGKTVEFNFDDKQTFSRVLGASSSSRELFSNGQIVTGVQGLHGNLSVHLTSRWPLPIRLTHNKQDPPRLSHFADVSASVLFPLIFPYLFLSAVGSDLQSWAKTCHVIVPFLPVCLSVHLYEARCLLWVNA